MRIRERKLFRDEEELRKDGIHNADFLEANRIFARARKRLDDIEKNLRGNRV